MGDMAEDAPERRYRALLIGNWHYPEDPANLPDLKGPLNDVSRLAELLADPARGLFAPADVRALTERASHEITAELEQFFGDATRRDVLLVYFSGHGLTADDGSLLLCGRNARTDRRLASTVSADTINRMMRACPAAAIVIILDCCHAGAFKSGEFAADLGGKGRFVLGASRSRDRAPDAEHDTGLSRFTGHLLRGLRGEARPDGSDHVTLSDLYRYVHRRMSEEGPALPQRRFDGEGDIPLVRSIAPIPSLTPAAGGLLVSEALIDVGEVRPGERLPTERVYIAATGPDGSPARWRAEASADWVTLRPSDAYLEVDLDPRADAGRANIIVHNERTGEARTIRIIARVAPAPVPPASGPVPPAPADVRVPADIDGDVITVGRWYVRVGQAVEQGEALADLFLDSNLDEEEGVFAPAAGTVLEMTAASGGVVRPGDRLAIVGPGPVRDGAPTGPPEEIVRAALREHAQRLAIQLGPGPRADQAARRRAGQSPAEPTLGVIELPAGGAVLFTTTTMVLIDGDRSVEVRYRDFPAASFSAHGGGAGLTHIDVGLGSQHEVGWLAAGLLDLLLDIQADLEG
jgi:uncharacterized caspase-like protein/biotin carboxyl carrier protein